MIHSVETAYLEVFPQSLVNTLYFNLPLASYEKIVDVFDEINPDSVLYHSEQTRIGQIGEELHTLQHFEQLLAD